MRRALDSAHCAPDREDSTVPCFDPRRPAQLHSRQRKRHLLHDAHAAVHLHGASGLRPRICALGSRHRVASRAYGRVLGALHDPLQAIRSVPHVLHLLCGNHRGVGHFPSLRNGSPRTRAVLDGIRLLSRTAGHGHVPVRETRDTRTRSASVLHLHGPDEPVYRRLSGHSSRPQPAVRRHPACARAGVLPARAHAPP